MTGDRSGGGPGPLPEDPWPHSPYPGLVAVAVSRRPRRLVAISSTATAALAAVAFVVAYAWPAGPDGGDTRPGFGPREEVRRVAFGQPVDNALTHVAGDRAYVAWQHGYDLSLVAVDLDTGEDAWTSVLPGADGRYWTDLLATPDVVVAQAEHPEADDAPAGADTLVVLSAVDGRRQWDREIGPDDSVWLGDDTLVLVDRARRVIRGLRLDTGSQHWRLGFRGGADTDAGVTPVLTAAHLAGPAPRWGPPAGPYQQLVVIGGDHSARVVDVQDGTIVDATGNVAHPHDLVLAYRDRLFIAFDYDGYRVDQRDLADLSAQPRSVYVTPDPRRSPLGLRPCAGDRLCLLDWAGSRWETVQVRAVELGPDRNADPVAWQHDAPYAQEVLPVGEWTLVAGDGTPVVGYDRAGSEVFTQPDGAAARLGPDRALLFATTPIPGHQDLSVAGLVTGGTTGGEPVQLGQFTGVHGARCAWSATHLACPDDAGAGIWRIAGG